MQIAEVCIRNAIHRALFTHHGVNWHDRGSFLCTLPDRLKNELADAKNEARAKYGAAVTNDHVVAALSFGFWLHLLTKNYAGVFWPKYYSVSFPNKPNRITQRDLYEKLDRLRLFRNRMFHHRPIFDHAPKVEYQNALELIGWVCEETQWFVSIISKIDQTIGAKPRIAP